MYVMKSTRIYLFFRKSLCKAKNKKKLFAK